jgi:GNAT superfamily N-acetyltransferase
MTISIRQLQPTDRGDWERLFRAYVDFYERSLEPEAYDRAWARMLADAEIHGRAACLDGRVVGIAHFLTHAHTNADDVCYLQDLFTAPAARGRGVAREAATRGVGVVARAVARSLCARRRWSKIGYGWAAGRPHDLRRPLVLLGGFAGATQTTKRKEQHVHPRHERSARTCDRSHPP